MSYPEKTQAEIETEDISCDENEDDFLEQVNTFHEIEDDDNFSDEKFDDDRAFFNEFYWERKKLFQTNLNTQSIAVVVIVNKLLGIFKKSKSSTGFHEDKEYFDELLKDCEVNMDA